jgi:23S rRNA (adenine2503-C2)-methyltransferase
MSAGKENLLGLNTQELAAFVETLGQRRFRGRQLFSWLYAKGATTFSSMTDLGKDFRAQLEGAARIEGIAGVEKKRSARDGTTKFLFSLADGLMVETVLIPPASAFQSAQAAREDEQRRLTLCVSTQVGCPLDCAFCATGRMGFLRNLSAGEIVDQVRRVLRLDTRKVTNIVFMGMGEPLLNYDAVMQASEIFTRGMAIASRRITVSTSGWVDGIRRMGEEKRREKLALSLHSAIDETRSRLMPVNRRCGLSALVSALEFYYRRTRQRVTFEHIFLDGINDSEREVLALIRLARRIPCKINVIPLHSTDFMGKAGRAPEVRPSSRMEEIVQRLRAEQLTVLVRTSAGEEIEAACGQLATVPERRRSPLGGSHVRRPNTTVQHPQGSHAL